MSFGWSPFAMRWATCSVFWCRSRVGSVAWVLGLTIFQYHVELLRAERRLKEMEEANAALRLQLVRAEARVLLAEEARAAAEAEALLALLKIGKDRVAGNEGGAG